MESGKALLQRIRLEHEAAYLTARQTATDSVVAIAEVVRYPDALLSPNLLVRSITQLVDLLM